MCVQCLSRIDEQKKEKERIIGIRLSLLNTLVIVVGFTFTEYSTLPGTVQEIWGLLIISFFISVFLIYSLMIKNKQWKYLDFLYSMTAVQFSYILLTFFYGHQILKNPQTSLIPLALSYLIVLTLAFSDSDHFTKGILILASLVLIIILILIILSFTVNQAANATYQSNSTYNFTETVTEVFPFIALYYTPITNQNTNQSLQNTSQMMSTEDVIEVRSKLYNTSEHPEMFFA